jgi:hypothetical protein
MKLFPDDRELFFSAFLGLLSYVNDKYNLVPDFGHPEIPAGLPLESIVTIKDKLWDNTSIIDEYIDSAGITSEEDIQILEGWKKKISGRLIILKHLKKHSIFLDNENGLLYGVIGITDSIDKHVANARLPVMVNAVLLPFKDIIIYDSILSIFNIHFGSNLRRSFNERYAEIKKEKGIITTIY